MTLKDLEIGTSGVIIAVGGEGSLRQHFLDMGVIPGAEVTLMKYAPMGDPMELRIHGYELTLRLADGEKVEIAPLGADRAREEAPREAEAFAETQAHPGLGEGGKYHVKGEEHPLPPGTQLTFALAGNQNCGKTTLFNQLTGANQHVGNFPGVTVDRKSGSIRGHGETLVTDLPGIYSLSPYTSEEIVSRQFILHEHPTGIINIVDATNIERNLYLTMQLMELDVPMVLALNMMDEVRGNGGTAGDSRGPHFSGQERGCRGTGQSRAPCCPIPGAAWADGFLRQKGPQRRGSSVPPWNYAFGRGPCQGSGNSPAFCSQQAGRG